MHELGITQNIVAIVSEHAQGFPVKRVTLEIGQLSAVMPDAIRFCFDVCCRGTVLEGSTLEILEIPGLGKCRQCGTEVALNEPFGICDRCGSADLEIVRGTELKIKEMEVKEVCA
ncbi:MAG: hydrogenase maturation nickel metallochaperone HypA [Hydrococcus sp. C42_A2020_068]|nr:hydrogenase maturation nickel metallochaperone HypA [Hydrococcus sp. C42_A2020_068]